MRVGNNETTPSGPNYLKSRERESDKRNYDVAQSIDFGHVLWIWQIVLSADFMSHLKDLFFIIIITFNYIDIYSCI